MAFGCALPFSHMIAPRRPAPAWRRGIEVVAAWTWPLLFIRSSRRDARDGMAVQLQPPRSEEHTSELQSLMRISYAVFCLKKKNQNTETEKRYNSVTKLLTKR